MKAGDVILIKVQARVTAVGKEPDGKVVVTAVPEVLPAQVVATEGQYEELPAKQAT